MPEGERILLVERFEEQLFLVTSLNSLLVLSLQAPCDAEMQAEGGKHIELLSRTPVTALQQ